MLSKQNIAIISSDFFVGYGFKSLLYEYFNPADVDVFSSINEYFDCKNTYHLLVVSAPTHLLYGNRFSIKNRIVVIAEVPQDSASAQVPVLYTRCSEQEVVEQLQHILGNFATTISSDTKNELSEREREVLAKVAQGAINKEIADNLNISLNTVITHRKNITAKLGIKTISGLTVYAILNGVISEQELPKS